MSESKWTPGPWRIGGDDRDEYWSVVVPGGDIIDMLADDQGRANARLISAAPDLAEVAEELIRIDANLTGQDRDDAMEDLIIAARAALSRAKGEAP